MTLNDLYLYLQIHLFSNNPELNRDVPSWFYDNCSRAQAEKVLILGAHFGNVLMRPSSTFQRTQKYVISMRRVVPG